MSANTGESHGTGAIMIDANLLNEPNAILGNRLLQERESSEKTLTRAAEQVGVTSNAIKSFESGRTAPSLPQLELLAALYRVPIARIMSAGDDLPPQPEIDSEKIASFTDIRNRIIAATLKQSRLKKKMTMKKLAESAGISSSMLRKYESGNTPIPEPVLQSFCLDLGMDIDALLSPLTAKRETAPVRTPGEPETVALPDEIREFIEHPANLPYLELAKRLSELDAAKLRAIAEDLLEITY